VQSISQRAENMKIYSVSLLVAVVLITFMTESTSADKCEEHNGISGTFLGDYGDIYTACCDKACPSCDSTENCKNLKSTVTGENMGRLKCCSRRIISKDVECGPGTNKNGEEVTRKAPCVPPDDYEYWEGE